MKCAIMQPHYMPWCGYFNLLAKVDVFVIYDDVQFEKQSWQNRNRILLNGASHWITVPVHRSSLQQTIDTVEVESGSRWREKQFRLLQQTYSKHPYAAEMLELAGNILNPELEGLADLSMSLIQETARRLELRTRIVRASSLNISGARSERLVRICEHLDCEGYLSPAGARDYLEQDGDFARSSVALSYQDYVPEDYPQVNSNTCITHLSILDAIANLGWEETCHYIQTGKTTDSHQGSDS